MRRSARWLGKAPVVPVGREGAATRASSSHSMADDEAHPSHRQKSILFTKDMVRKIFNVTSGSRAVELLRRNEPHVLREPYRVGSRAPTRRTIEVLEVADVLDVVTIKRAWVLLCIALVLSPGTGNMVPLEYLASLVDIDSINEFAWDEHFLAVALNELRRLAETPYVRLDSCSEAQHQNNKFVWTDAPTHEIPSNPAFDGCEVGGDVCGSLDEWLHPPRASEEMEIPRHMIPIYEKHKKLHATEVKKVLKSFGQVLEGMFCKRLASILVEANANATSSNHHHHKPGDVTFHAPAGNAADAGHTRAPIHTSPEAHKSPAPQEVDADKEVARCSNTKRNEADKEVAGCSNAKQNEAQRDIGLEKMQSCCFPGTKDVQQGPVLGEREKSVGAEVGGGGDLKDPDVADECQNVILS
ncbi:hypothetical protein ZWY2020_040373 [Hordeum vulgare]|nr:hypothetical protein ZWY2020_040373 [Hordeum vulgare]